MTSRLLDSLRHIGDTQLDSIMKAQPVDTQMKVFVPESERTSKGARAAFFSMAELSETSRQPVLRLRTSRLQHIQIPVGPSCPETCSCETLEQRKKEYLALLEETIAQVRKASFVKQVVQGLVDNIPFSSLDISEVDESFISLKEAFAADYEVLRKRRGAISSSSPKQRNLEEEFEAFFPATLSAFEHRHGLKYREKFETKFPFPDESTFRDHSERYISFREFCMFVWLSSENNYHVECLKSPFDACKWLYSKKKPDDGVNKFFSFVWTLVCAEKTASIKDVNVQASPQALAIAFVDRHREFTEQASMQKSIEDIQMLLAILDEHDQHTMARFYHLLRIYSGFIRHILGMADSIANGDETLKKAVIGNCIQILSHAHDKDPTTASVCLTHHSHNVMGCEEKGTYEKEDIERWLRRLNSALSYRTVEQYEHAHTFPDPTVFNWKLTCPDERDCNLSVSDNFFEEIKKDGLNPLIDEAIYSAFAAHLQTLQTTDSKMHALLHVVKSLYLLLISETELVPDFINQELDQLSEWFYGEHDNYKTSLSQALVLLLQKEDPSINAVIEALTPYFNGAFKKIHEQLQEVSRTNSLQKRKDHFIRQIGVIQVHQAACGALGGTLQPVIGQLKI